VLLDLQNHRRRADAQLVLAAPSAPVRRVLCVTGLDKTLPASVFGDARSVRLSPASSSIAQATRSGRDIHAHARTLHQHQRLP
jgi:hypothetical protein